MTLEQFEINSFLQTITLYFNGNRGLVLHIDENSGRIVKRGKIATIFQVEHFGIYVGKDQSGVPWYIHNHIDNGKVKIEPQAKFARLMPIFFESKPSRRNGLDIVKYGLSEVIKGTKYSIILNNCQHLTSRAAGLPEKSQDLQKVAGFLGGAGLLMTMSKNKAVRNLGIGLSVVGLGTLLIDKLR